ncbi:MAG: class I SAM-dependent methyltransferase [Nitrospiraceae bacterium]|nr:MAG: class I SAM-dependent methyltransferase [Nitrospiraceae bacterium]
MNVPMKNDIDSWINFWKTETVISDDKWQSDMELFIKATSPLLNYNSQDVILDLGCGPGFLASFLKNRVKEIHCLDTSERYLDICKIKFSKDQNIFLYKLDENNYTDLSSLQTGKFSLVICLSVIQYYKSIDEVKRLIEQVQRIALPGGKLLIADILVHSNTFSDIWGVLLTGIRERKLSETLKYLFRMKMSNYYRTRSSLGLLYLSFKQLNDLSKTLGLKAEVLSAQITTNRNRKHLLIRF